MSGVHTAPEQATVHELSLEPDEILRAKNSEDYMVAAEDDEEGMERTVWSIKQCVCHADCAHGPWQKANVWSLGSPSKCLQYMKQHLCISGKHAMTENAAQEAIMAVFYSLEFEVATDTFSDRQWYREQLGRKNALESAAHKRKRSTSDGSAGRGYQGGSKGGGKDDVLSLQTATVDFNQQIQMAIGRSIAPALRSALSNLGLSEDRDDLQLTIHGSNSALANTTAVPSHAVGNQITVSTEVLKTLRENARRSEEALKSAMLTMVEGAKRVRSELQSAMQVRTDIDDLIAQSAGSAPDL